MKTNFRIPTKMESVKLFDRVKDIMHDILGLKKKDLQDYKTLQDDLRIDSQDFA